jgi:pyruvate kinase
MKSIPDHVISDAWDAQACDALIEELWSLRTTMIDHEARLEPWLREVDPEQVASAVNLAHYLALRRFDLRRLQERLAGLGVSSLGRAEAHVLANLDKVLGILHRLAGRSWQPLTGDEPAGRQRGRRLLEKHAEALFGTVPAERRVRIMVTLPSEAAHDDALVDGLVKAGMDIARINCAHDAADDWVAMATRVRKAARSAGRHVRVLMDLGGPKLRTGPIAGGVAVVKLKPERDALGTVTQPARLGLRALGSTAPVAGATVCVGVDADWLDALQVGGHIGLTDARSARRRLIAVERQAAGMLVECERTAYLTEDTCLRVHQRATGVRETTLDDLPVAAGRLHLQRGEILNLVAHGVGHGALAAAKGQRAKRAKIACTLPEALPRVRKGERIWFDDGRIGGVVRRAGAKRVEVEITEARDGGEWLAADKGINLPDTRLDLPALTAKDLEDLAVVARCADLVGLSFAQSAADVRTLRARLVELGAAQVGLILKIETRRGFDHLPEMLLAAMAGPAAGVMIARGDLAVECGYERMAEVQEEILWACEAAHLPVVWATQVLETLAKTGLPSRAEITDAAMGGRAECVMLNKGPHIVGAMRTLDDILRRMQAHQSKKRPLLRALKAWTLALDAAGPAAAAPPAGPVHPVGRYSGPPIEPRPSDEPVLQR